MDKELAAYTSKHKVIIFSSPKPISGADNKTDYFLEKLKRNENSTFNIEQKLLENRVESVIEKKAEVVGEGSQENAQKVTNQSLITSEFLAPSLIQNDTLREAEKSEQKLAKEDEKPVKPESIMDNISPTVIDTLKQPGPVQLTELSKEG